MELPLKELPVESAFMVKPNGRIYTIVDKVVSIYNKKIRYVLADSQGQVTAFEPDKLVYTKK